MSKIEELESIIAAGAKNVIALHARIGELKERIKKAEAERDELKRDAGRYRWLRDNRLSANINFAMAMNWRPELLSCDQIDAAIDACIISSNFVTDAIDAAAGKGEE